MIKVFISGPIRAEDRRQVAVNLQAGRDAAWRLIGAGFVPLCPHMEPVEWAWMVIESDELLKKMMRVDFEKVRMADALLMLPGWRESVGACQEYELARKLGKPIFFTEESLINDSRRIWKDRLR